jgi:hypothetical protein
MIMLSWITKIKLELMAYEAMFATVTVSNSDCGYDYPKLVLVIRVIHSDTQTTRNLLLYLSSVVSWTIEIVTLLGYNSLGLNKWL